jgi:hypothetical protein
VRRTQAEDRARAAVLPRAPAPLRRGGAEVVLSLQRTAGNQRVARAVEVELRQAPAPRAPDPALERVTPENQEMAKEIDALERLPDATVLKRRAQAAERAAAVSGTDHAAAERELEAAEYVASTRRLPPPQLDWALYDKVKHVPEKRRVYVRGLVEERVRDGGSFAEAVDSFPDGQQIQYDLDPLRADAKAFAREFRGQAWINAERMLRGSLRAIADVLHSYGIPVDSALVAAERLLQGHTTEEEAANVVRRAKQTADDPGGANAPGAAQHRMRLAEWVERLRQHQQRVNAAFIHSNKAVNDVPVNGETKALHAAHDAKLAYQKEKGQLAALWIQAERLHPVLAAYRTGDPLEKIDLGALDTAGVDDEMKLLLEHALPKVANIAKAHALIKSRHISPLALPSVVALTKANMYVPAGSIRAGVINDLVEEERKSRDSTLMIAVSIALALVTLVPSGGASLAVPAGIASAGLAAYSALKELDHYETTKTLHDTDLDRARALSDEEPSLTGFAVALISFGFEGAALIAAFRAAVQIRRLAAAGEQGGSRIRRLLGELDAQGEKRGIKGLGKRALEEGHPEPPGTGIPPGGKGEPPPPKGGWDDEVTQDIPVPARPATTLSTGLSMINNFTSREQVKRAVVQALIKDLKFGMSEAMLPQEWPLVLKALRATPGRHNAQILELLPTVMGGLRDPELYGEVMADAWRIAKGPPPSDVNAALREMASAGGRPPRVLPEHVGVMKSKAFFADVASQGETWVDDPLLFDPHGAFTHLLQDLVVDRALARAGANLRSTGFRELLGQAEGTVVEAEGFATTANTTFIKNAKEFETDMKTGDYVWRFTYDILQDGHINKPEDLKVRMQLVLGMR